MTSAEDRSRTLRLLQLAHLEAIGAITTPDAESLRGHERFLTSYTFRQTGPSFSGGSGTLEGVAADLVVIEKPCDVRLDIPRRRPAYYGTKCDSSESEKRRRINYSDEDLRHFPEEVTVADWYSDFVAEGPVRFCNQLDFATSGLLVLGKNQKRCCLGCSPISKPKESHPQCGKTLSMSCRRLG